jgi:hypothetical protein
MATLQRSIDQSHAPQRGKDAGLYVAIFQPGNVKADFAPQVLTMASAAAKGATSITLTSAPAKAINKGQCLCFADANDVEHLVIVAAKTTSATITVEPLGEAITTAEKAEYPAYVWDRTDVNLSESVSIETTETFNTGGFEDGVAGTTSASIEAGGLKNYYNAGAATLAKAKQLGAFVWARYEESIPSAAFTAGEVTESRAAVEKRDRANPAKGFGTDDYSLKLLGKNYVTNPVPV